MSRWTTKTDTAATAKAAKVMVRRNVLEAIGGPSAAKVFDAFAGRGDLYRAAWKDAAGYTGCDLRYFPDERRAFVADNRRVMRCIDLDAFNVFDLDAYGSPWEQALILSARRPLRAGELVGLVVTEGNGINYKNNIVPRAVAQLIGLQHAKAAGLKDRRDEVIGAIIGALCRRMRAEVVRRWQAQRRSGAWVYYIGLVLRGKGGAAN